MLQGGHYFQTKPHKRLKRYENRVENNEAEILNNITVKHEKTKVMSYTKMNHFCYLTFVSIIRYQSRYQLKEEPA